MIRYFLTVLTLSLAAWAQLPANLLTQSMTWPSSQAPSSSYASGTPFEMGVPLPDAAAIQGVLQGAPNNLKLCTTSDCSSGQQSSQFRCGGLWPSGNCKWVFVDGQTQNAVTPTTIDNALFLVKSAGGGNNGGSNILTQCTNAGIPDALCDNGNEIVVHTGTMNAVITGPNFDLYHYLAVGATVLVPKAGHGSQDGLILMGPPTNSSPNTATCNNGKSGAQPSGGNQLTMTAISASSNVVTVTLALPNTMIVGETITVQGVTGFNGTYTVATVISTTQFTYNNTQANGSGVITPNSVLTDSSHFNLEVGCNTAYLSNLDAAGSATIEENGPLRGSVLVKTGLTNSAQSCPTDGVTQLTGCYLWETLRLMFYQNQNYARVEEIQRNANFTTTNNNFTSAYKQFASLNAQVTVTLATGNKTATVGNCNQPGLSGCPTTLPAATTATLTTTNDDVYLYQAYSDAMQWSDWNSSDCVAEGDRCVVSPINRSLNKVYNQNGYQIVKNGAQVGPAGTSGTVFNVYPSGWADIQDSNGAGVTIGVKQLAGYWPKALEYIYASATTVTVKVGIWPDQTKYLPTPHGDQPYVVKWPAVQIHDLFFDFHTAALSSPQDAFLKFQHPIIGRVTPYTYYNSASDATTGLLALEWPINDPIAEDSYLQGVTAGTSNPYCKAGTSAALGNCLQDASFNATGIPGTYVIRHYDSAQGGTNQSDYYRADMQDWVSRGCAPNGTVCTTASRVGSVPGRYAAALQWATFIAEKGLPRSDWCGGWRGDGTLVFPCGTSQPACPTDNCSTETLWGFPNILSLNGGDRDFDDNPNTMDHAWYWGMPDIYWLTGEEFIKEQLLQGYKDIVNNQHIKYNNPNVGSTSGVGGMTATRVVGHGLALRALMSLFLSSINDAEADSGSLNLASNIGHPLWGADNAVLYQVSPDLPLPNLTAAGGPGGENEPPGCTSPYNTSKCTSGVSRLRGDHYNSQMKSDFPYNSDSGSNARAVGAGVHATAIINGLWLYRQAANELRGTNWQIGATVNTYNELTGDLPILDYIYLIGQGSANDHWAFINSTFQGPTFLTFPDSLNHTDMSVSCAIVSNGTSSCNACSDQAFDNGAGGAGTFSTDATGKLITDTSPITGNSGSVFSAADVGLQFVVMSNTGSNATILSSTTIVSFQSNTQITLAAPLTPNSTGVWRISNSSQAVGNSCSRRCDIAKGGCNALQDGWLNYAGLGLVTNTNTELDGVTNWQAKFEYLLQHDSNAGYLGTQYGAYHLEQGVFEILQAQNSNNFKLQQIPITSITNCGGVCGTSPQPHCTVSCTINWNNAGVCSGLGCPYMMAPYRLKYTSTGKQIVNWLGWKSNCLTTDTTPDCPGSFGLTWNAQDNSGAAVFNPANFINWGAATNIPDGSSNTLAVTGNSYNAVCPVGTCFFYLAGFSNGSQCAPPSAPTGLTATGGILQVALTWNASTGATSYNVLRSLTFGGPYNTIASTTSPTYIDTAVNAGTTYYYVVQAVSGCGTSGNSGQASATPLGTPTATGTVIQ